MLIIAGSIVCILMLVMFIVQIRRFTCWDSISVGTVYDGTVFQLCYREHDVI